MVTSAPLTLYAVEIGDRIPLPSWYGLLSVLESRVRWVVESQNQEEQCGFVLAVQ